jgi:hypothetical protein
MPACVSPFNGRDAARLTRETEMIVVVFSSPVGIGESRGMV